MSVTVLLLGVSVAILAAASAARVQDESGRTPQTSVQSAR